MSQIRLNKLISESGICSRREADKMIEMGRVTVNGKTPEVGLKIGPADVVKVDGRLLKQRSETVYIAFNKPVGIVCTTDLSESSNIISYVNYPERIFNIGRLDKDSEGLIFLTNDGDIVNKILRAGNLHEKEYIVTVDKPITDEFIADMTNGVPILGTMTRKSKLFKETATRFRIVLTQGLNRQIRRMCEALGYEVVKLKRTRIMNVTLDKIPTGEWRFFSETEVQEINKMIASSSKTQEASIGGGRSKKREDRPSGLKFTKLFKHSENEKEKQSGRGSRGGSKFVSNKKRAEHPVTKRVLNHTPAALAEDDILSESANVLHKRDRRKSDLFANHRDKDEHGRAKPERAFKSEKSYKADKATDKQLARFEKKGPKQDRSYKSDKGPKSAGAKFGAKSSGKPNSGRPARSGKPLNATRKRSSR